MISKKRQSETLRNTIMFPRCFPCDPISCPAVTSALMSPAIGMSMIHLLSDSPTMPVFRPLSVCVCVPQFACRSVTMTPPSPGHRIPLSLAAPAPGSHEASGFSHPGSHFPGCKSSPLSLSCLICVPDPLFMIYLTTGSIYIGSHPQTQARCYCYQSCPTIISNTIIHFD